MSTWTRYNQTKKSEGVTTNSGFENHEGSECEQTELRGRHGRYLLSDICTFVDKSTLSVALMSHDAHQILSFKICCLWGGLSPSDHWVVLFTCQWWPSGCWFSSWCLEQTEVPRLFQWSRWEPGSAPEESSHLLVHLVKRRNEAPPLCRPSAPGSAPEEPQCHLGYVGTWHLALIVGHNKPF